MCDQSSPVKKRDEKLSTGWSLLLRVPASMRLLLAREHKNDFASADKWLRRQREQYSTDKRSRRRRPAWERKHPTSMHMLDDLLVLVRGQMHQETASAARRKRNSRMTEKKKSCSASHILVIIGRTYPADIQTTQALRQDIHLEHRESDDLGLIYYQVTCLAA